MDARATPVFAAEIRQIMYVAGETADLSIETVALVENIVREQVTFMLSTANEYASRRGSPVISNNDLIFQFRHDATRVDRLQKVLFCKHIRKFAREDDDEINQGEEEALELKDDAGNGPDANSTDDVNRRTLLAVTTVPWDTSSRYPELPRSVEDVEVSTDSTEANLMELREADRRTMTMSLREYETWSEYRHASFTRRRTKRFRQWSGLGVIAEHRNGDDVLDILGFLTGEMVRRLTALALALQRRELHTSNARSADRPSQKEDLGLFSLGKDSRQKPPVDVRHIRQAYDATQAWTVGSRSCARGRWSRRGLQLI
ncbi:transcription initiation protein spt3 [Purpureocillium lilacinum]|nr:transcription initiation protein spt3 [Purpureocillium lilacinum]